MAKAMTDDEYQQHLKSIQVEYKELKNIAK